MIRIMGCFAVSRDRDWRSKNPDIIPLNQVSNVHTEVEEHKKELYTKDAEGKNVSYNPRQYEYSYEFEVEINVNSPYFDEIKFELSDMSSRPKNTFDMNYQNLQMQANQIQQALMSYVGRNGNESDGNESYGRWYEPDGSDERNEPDGRNEWNERPDGNERYEPDGSDERNEPDGRNERNEPDGRNERHEPDGNERHEPDGNERNE